MRPTSLNAFTSSRSGLLVRAWMRFNAYDRPPSFCGWGTCACGHERNETEPGQQDK